MRTFHYLSEIRAHTPADEHDTYIFFEAKKKVYVWSGSEWVERNYFTRSQAAKLIGCSVQDISRILLNYDRYFSNRKKKRGSIRIHYGYVLKLKYVLEAMRKGTLQDLITAGTLVNLYGAKASYHPI